MLFFKGNKKIKRRLKPFIVEKRTALQGFDALQRCLY
jgi:hypothetical protein